MRARWSLVSLLLGAVILGLGAVSAGQGHTLRVEPGGSIQAAINAANPGDTIEVPAGTYRENLVITKPVALIGAGAGKTVIESVVEDHPVITIESGRPIEVRLAGVTVTGGLGGLVVRGRAQVTVEDSTVSGNAAAASG